MNDVIQILLSLIGGGVIGKLIDLFLSRKKRKKEGIESLMETIDMLMESNSSLIADKVDLEHQIARLKAQIHSAPSLHKPIYPRSRRMVRKPPRVNKNDDDTQDFSPEGIDDPCPAPLDDEPP